MKFRILTFFAFAVIAFLAACKGKDSDVATPSDKNPPLVNTVNATTNTINVYQNATRQNNTSFITPNGATSYLYFLRGTQNIQFKNAGSSDVLFTESYTLDTSKYYSIFVAGTTADKAFLTTDAIDTAESRLSDSTALIRFVNASPDAGALNLTFNKADTVNIKSIAFKDASPFVSFNALRTQEVKVYLSGSSTAKLDTTISFQTATIYTIFTRGSVTGTGGSALGLTLIANPYSIKNQ